MKIKEDVTEKDYQQLLYDMVEEGIIREIALRTFELNSMFKLKDRPAEPEKETIHHAFKPLEYRCQMCGSADELAHMWKCECGVVGNGEKHVHTDEDDVK